MTLHGLRDRHRPVTITDARRTMTGWFEAITGAGLRVEEIAEPHASEQPAGEHPEVADTRIVAYFVMFSRQEAGSTSGGPAVVSASFQQGVHEEAGVQHE